ncbi:hypothetical protein COBT_001169, partial [Conglomerata obtusa]
MTLSISVLTYNVHDTPKLLSILSNLKPHLNSNIIFITLQEVYRPFAKHKDLIKQLNKLFNGKNIIYERLWGLISIVITESKDYKSLKMGLGPHHLPNKGFIATKVDNILFVGCHLAAGNDNHNRRMDMFNNAMTAIYTYFVKIDTLIIAGDFNFRVEKNVEQIVSNRKVNKNIKSVFENLENLEKHILTDQGRLFFEEYNNLKEGRILFKPTYKFLVNSDDYDTKRIPSWCDRIIFGSKYQLKCENYNAINIFASDHKPVIAHFELNEGIKIDDTEI